MVRGPQRWPRQKRTRAELDAVKIEAEMERRIAAWLALPDQDRSARKRRWREAQRVRLPGWWQT